MSFTCAICNRDYGSRHSLYNHRRIKHKNVTDIKNDIIVTHPDIISSPSKKNEYNCSYCNNVYTHRNNRNRHMKSCSKRNEPSILELSKTIDELKDKILKLESANTYTANKNTLSNSTNCNMNNIENMNITNNIQNIVIEYKNTDMLENDMKMEDALNILKDNPQKMIEAALNLIYTNDEYIPYRTAIVKDENAPTMEIFNFNKKKFVKVKMDSGLTNVVDEYSNSLHYMSGKYIDDIGKDKDYEIYVNSRKMGTSGEVLNDEKKRIKRALFRHHKNAQCAKEKYELQGEH
jgi:hypothetical protein